MRKITILLVAILFTLAGLAYSVPMTVAHQGRLTDATGNPSNGIFDVTYRLFDVSTGGTALWSETQPVTVSEGLFTSTLGETNPLDFSTIGTRPDSLWLEVQVGSDSPISPRTKINSVPIAAVATSLQGDIGAENGILAMTDSLGDTTIVWDANARRGIITNLHPPGNGTGTGLEAGRVSMTNMLGDTVIMVGLFGDPDFTGLEIGNGDSPDGGTVLSSGVNALDHRGHVTVLKIANGGLDTTNMVGLFGDPDFAALIIGDSALSIKDDASGVSLRMNKGELIDAIASEIDNSVRSSGISKRAARTGRNPQTGATMQMSVETVLNDTTGASLSLRRLDDDSDDDGLFDLIVDEGGAAFYMNKAELIDAIASSIEDRAGKSSISRRAARTGRNPQTGATIQMSAETELNDTTGGSFSMRRLDEDSDDDDWVDLAVDDAGVSLRMNKGELIDAISMGAMSVDSAKALLTLSKADAGKALNAIVSSSIVGLTLIDSTLNDSGLIDLRLSGTDDNGVSIRSAKRVAKFKAGADLSKKVNKNADDGREGAYMGIAGELDRFVEIIVDSVSSTLVFGDTLGDTTMVMRSGGAGGGGGAGGLIQVRSNNIGTGMAPSSAEIGDIDSDGLVDLRVDGNVGIGISSPTNILEIVQGSLTDPIADAWTTYSSRRWKENIRTIDSAIEKVLKLRGVEYNWKADGKHDIGLIAEEVGLVIPEVVVFEKNGVDAQSVDYPRLVALLIEAVKEQHGTIDELNGKITKAEKIAENLENMTSKITQLELMVELLLANNSATNNMKYADGK